MSAIDFSNSKKFNLRNDHSVEFVRIGDPDSNIVQTGNLIWHVRSLGVPSDDPEESFEGYELLDWDCYMELMVAARSEEFAYAVVVEELKFDSVSYRDSHWTIELIGLDTRTNPSKEGVLIYHQR